MKEKTGVQITSEADATVVAFVSATVCDVVEVEYASGQIKEFVEEHHPKKMVFDFGGVKFFSSQVLGLLLDIRKKIGIYDGEIVISAIDPQLHRIFKITCLDRIFRFFPDRESAVRDISREQSGL
jgi:anti-sigma B factor antagonist